MIDSFYLCSCCKLIIDDNNERLYKLELTMSDNTYVLNFCQVCEATHIIPLFACKGTHANKPKILIYENMNIHEDDIDYLF